MMQTAEMLIPGDPTITTRSKKLYNPSIILYKHATNTVRILCKNQDQKPVPAAGFTISAKLYDRSDTVTPLKLTKTVTIIDVPKGVGIITIDPADVSLLEPRYYDLVLTQVMTVGSTQNVIYSDDYYSTTITIDLRAS